MLFVRVVSGRASAPFCAQCAVWSAIGSVVVVGCAERRRVLGDGTVLLAWEVMRRMVAV